jgi:hypothetical protein
MSFLNHIDNTKSFSTTYILKNLCFYQAEFLMQVNWRHERCQALIIHCKCLAPLFWIGFPVL